MINISNYSYDVLCEAYNQLNEACGKPESLLIAFMKKKANDRSALLKQSAIDSNYVDSKTLEELIGSGYVQKIKNTSLLALTAEGVWEVEFRTKDDPLNDLLNGINDQFFDEFENVSITGRNKVVLFAMICMRSFSQDSSVDIRMEKDVTEEWWQIFVKVDEYLINMGVITKDNSITKERKSAGTESNVSDLIRHSDRIPRYTDGIYSKSGKQQYWLDLITNKEIDVTRLSKLIKLTLGDKINYNNYEDYARFANDLCLDYGFLISQSYKESKFLSCDYDFIIRDSFEKASYLQLN